MSDLSLPNKAGGRYSPVSALGTFIGETSYRNFMPLAETIAGWRHTDPPVILTADPGVYGEKMEGFHFAVVLYYACRATRPHMPGFRLNRVTNPHTHSIAELYLRWATRIVANSGGSLEGWVPADPPPATLHEALRVPSPPWLDKKPWENRSPDRSRR